MYNFLLFHTCKFVHDMKILKRKRGRISSFKKQSQEEKILSQEINSFKKEKICFVQIIRKIIYLVVHLKHENKKTGLFKNRRFSYLIHMCCQEKWFSNPYFFFWRYPEDFGKEEECIWVHTIKNLNKKKIECQMEVTNSIS